MKFLRFIPIGAVLLALVLTGCSPDDPTSPDITIDQPAGREALARYVAIGNSLTAGYMDNGLSVVGQLASYPAQISGQLGVSPLPDADPWFAQPLVALPGVGQSTPSSPANVAGVLHWDGQAISVLDETPLADLQSTLLLASSYPTPYNNLGVPGATTLDVTQALTSASSQSPGNVYFDLILRNPTFGDVAMLGQAIAQGPTLATIWIGNNDILGGATSGDPVIGENITPGAAFETMLAGIVDGLVEGVDARFGYTPHMVVANIPSITSIPYFLPKAVFDQIVTQGQGSYPSVEDDVVYVRFPVLGTVGDLEGDPLPTDATLTAGEVADVEAAVMQYNTIIDDLALIHDYTVADVNAALSGLDADQRTHFQLLVGGGATVEQAAATTVFSLDGIHPNSAGQSLVANVFIDAINIELGLEGAEALEPVASMAWDPTYAAYTGKAGSLAAIVR
jgi:lysophospholipase L1-like esterase